MRKLPFSSKREPLGIKNFLLFSNKYVSNNANDSGLTLFVKGTNGNAMLPGDCKYAIAEGETNEAIERMKARNRDLCLVIPHHGGKAGKSVTYNVPEAKTIEGIVSVGEDSKKKYGHPNDEVMKLIKTHVPKVRMTKDSGDIDVRL